MVVVIVTVVARKMVIATSRSQKKREGKGNIDAIEENAI